MKCPNILPANGSGDFPGKHAERLSMKASRKGPTTGGAHDNLKALREIMSNLIAWKITAIRPKKRSTNDNRPGRINTSDINNNNGPKRHRAPA